MSFSLFSSSSSSCFFFKFFTNSSVFLKFSTNCLSVAYKTIFSTILCIQLRLKLPSQMDNQWFFQFSVLFFQNHPVLLPISIFSTMMSSKMVINKSLQLLLCNQLVLAASYARSMNRGRQASKLGDVIVATRVNRRSSSMFRRTNCKYEINASTCIIMCSCVVWERDIMWLNAIWLTNLSYNMCLVSALESG